MDWRKPRKVRCRVRSNVPLWKPARRNIDPGKLLREIQISWRLHNRPRENSGCEKFAKGHGASCVMTEKGFGACTMFRDVHLGFWTRGQGPRSAGPRSASLAPSTIGAFKVWALMFLLNPWLHCDSWCLRNTLSRLEDPLHYILVLVTVFHTWHATCHLLRTENIKQLWKSKRYLPSVGHLVNQLEPCLRMFEVPWEHLTVSRNNAGI